MPKKITSAGKKPAKLTNPENKRRVLSAVKCLRDYSRELGTPEAQAAIQADIEQEDVELLAAGFDHIGDDLDRLNRLRVALGLSSDDLTPETTLLDYVAGHRMRQESIARINQRVSTEAKIGNGASESPGAETGNAATHGQLTDRPVLNKAWFRKATGLSNSHIANMMREAEVKRAPRGDKTYEWTEKEAEKTLRYIISHSQNEKVQEKAKTALREITI